MTRRQVKAGYFALTGLNTLATSYFFSFLFFYLRGKFGFGDRENLWVSALHGFIYIFAAWQCGRFAARFGRRFSLKLGFAGLALVMAAGPFIEGAAAMLGLVAAYTVVLLLTWPALEALVSEREDRSGMQEMVGIYNCIWAGVAAFAYFTGGKLFDALGAGAVFWVPAGIFLLQFLMMLWLDGKHTAAATTAVLEKEPPHTPEASSRNQPVSPQAFLKMAWLANPFAYIAINTLIAVMPGIAQKLGLTVTQAGLFCSAWFFGRFAAFVLLWKWPGWHYRFRWLIGAFILLVASLGVILLSRELWVIVVAQLFFGFATGKLYYASLFYSMDVGQAGSEHGGLHEAFIGAGIFLGPAAGAAALTLAPGSPDIFAWCVCGLLATGLGGLVWLRLASSKKASPG